MRVIRIHYNLEVQKVTQDNRKLHCSKGNISLSFY